MLIAIIDAFITPPLLRHHALLTLTTLLTPL
jgi:hypothetical protein